MSWLVLHWLYMYVLRQIKIMLCYVMYWFSRPFVFVCAIVCLGDRSSVRYHSFVWSFDFLIVRLCYRSIFYRSFVWSFDFFNVCLCDDSRFLSFVCVTVHFFMIRLCDNGRLCDRSFLFKIVRLWDRTFVHSPYYRLCDHSCVWSRSYMWSSVRYHSFVWSFDVLMVRLCDRSIFLSFVCVIVRFFIVCLCDHSVFLSFVCMIVRFFHRSFVWSFDFFIVCLCDHLGFFLSFVCVTVRFLWFVCAIMVVYVIVRFCSRSFVYEIVRLFIRLTIVCDLVRFGDSS